MWRYYKEAVYEELPKAQVIVDRFHVIQLVNNALEGERKSFKGSLDKKRRSKLLKDRFLLLRNKEDLNARQIWDMQLMFLDFPQLKLYTRNKLGTYVLNDEGIPSKDLLVIGNIYKDKKVLEENNERV